MREAASAWKRWRKSSSELPTPGFASRIRQRYSPTASTSPRRTRSRSQGEKSTHGTQLDGLCARERQGKSGWPSPAAKPGRSAATRSARVMAVEPKSRVCIVKRRPRFRFDSGHGSSREGRATPRRPSRAGNQNILTLPALLARVDPQPISGGLYNEPATTAGVLIPLDGAPGHALHPNQLPHHSCRRASCRRARPTGSTSRDGERSMA